MVGWRGRSPQPSLPMKRKHGLIQEPRTFKSREWENVKGLKPIYVPTVVCAHTQVFISSDVCPQNQEYLKMWSRSEKQKKGIGIMVSVPLALTLQPRHYDEAE